MDWQIRQKEHQPNLLSQLYSRLGAGVKFEKLSEKVGFFSQ